MSDKEQLENIKKRLVLLHNAINVDDETKNYIFEDLKIEWLIERVQELELECVGWKEAVRFEDEKLAKQNKRYREAITKARAYLEEEIPIIDCARNAHYTLSNALKGEE